MNKIGDLYIDSGGHTYLKRNPKDYTDKLITKYEDTGRIAVRYKRKKEISVDGLTLPEKEAIIRMKDCIERENPPGMIKCVTAIASEHNTSPQKILSDFQKEKEEHPDFSNEDILQIVDDHLKENPPNIWVGECGHKEEAHSVTITPGVPTTKNSWCAQCGKDVNWRLYTNGVPNPGLFAPTKSPKYKKIIKISSPTGARKSTDMLTREWKSAKIRDKKRRLIKYATLAMNRANAATKKTSMKHQTKVAYRASANIYSHWLSLHKLT